MPAKSPPFLMWYDDNPRLSVSHKIAAAMAAYRDRFHGVQPTLVLVNEADLTEVAGVQVRAVATVGRNTYWVGQTEQREAPEAPLHAPLHALPPATSVPQRSGARRPRVPKHP